MANKEQNSSFQRLFSPLTTVKAISLICILGLIVYFNVFCNSSGGVGKAATIGR
jgi:hypothetical protein